MVEDPRIATLQGLGVPGAPEETPRFQPVTRLNRLRWVLLTCAIVAILGVVAGALVGVHYAKARPLSCVCTVQWAFDQDATAATQDQVSGINETSVPLRPQSRQGFYLSVANRSAVTQRVVGANFSSDNPGALRDVAVKVVSRAQVATAAGASLPVVSSAIPPSSQRYLLITWTSTGACPLPSGASVVLHKVDVQVQVGMFTRSEVLRLPENVVLTSQPNC